MWQVYFLVLFFYLFGMMWYPRHETVPSNLFLRVDPLSALGVVLSQRILPALLWPSLLLLILTFFFGRFFCSWVCPLGTLNEGVSWLSQRFASTHQRMEANRPNRSHAWKTFLLLASLGMAALGVLETGFLSPLSLVHRSISVGLGPALHEWLPGLYVTPPVFKGAWLIGGLLILILALNFYRPRFWCRSLCPLGALLGICSRMAPFRIRRDENLCIHCGQCVAVCAGACEPDGSLRQEDCVQCLRCRDVCPTKAITVGTILPQHKSQAAVNLQRRHLLLAGLTGLIAAPFVKVSGWAEKRRKDRLLRPPGALDEEDFLGRCVQCGACMRVCPNNALQPALGMCGPQGLFSPVLVPRIGYCELHCTSCGEVCPTGAIRALTIEERTGPERVTCGTAFFDRSRCLTWAFDTPCGVCEEVCPVSPKAIVREEVTVTKYGEPFTFHRYKVDPARCVGCGLCEHVCPLHGEAGIRVSSVGESRSPDRRLLLQP